MFPHFRCAGSGSGFVVPALTLASLAAGLAGQESRPAPARTDAQKALDEALRDLPQDAPRRGGDAIASAPLGGATLKLLDVSLNALVSVGTSTERDAGLESLQAGAHDPRKRGFTFQQAELSLIGAVDPYFKLESHLIFGLDPYEGETEVELEELFATSTSLPAGLQLKLGHYFTEFGRLNAQHPHQWDWQDAPVITSRLFGPDGMRAPGARLGWLTPAPFFLEVLGGVQNANGETMASFLANEEYFAERGVAGRLFTERDVRSLGDVAWSMRVHGGLDLSETVHAAFGVSGLYGPNATGGEGDTWIYGADLKVKWQPLDQQRGWPFVIWQSEFLRRAYDADAQVDDRGTADPGDDVSLAARGLTDWGVYTQLLWGLQPDWALGVRYDYATGNGDLYDRENGVFVSRDLDPFRNDRHRVSPMVVWHASEFSRIRLQYNYDRAEHLHADEAHSVWLGFEFLIGAHPAHTY